MHYYIPISTHDGTVIIRSSENACISVCCVFSLDGALEIARFDNSKIAQSMCNTWNDEQFQVCKPFLFNMVYCVFICKEDFQDHEIYDLDREIYKLMDEETACEIEEIRCQFMNSLPRLFVTKPGTYHPSLEQEIISMQ
jgi:hypothetical protein